MSVDQTSQGEGSGRHRGNAVKKLLISVGATGSILALAWFALRDVVPTRPELAEIDALKGPPTRVVQVPAAVDILAESHTPGWDLTPYQSRLLERWLPPPETAGTDVLFPIQFHVYRRVVHDLESNRLARLAGGNVPMGLKGEHAEYRADEKRVEVFVFRLDERTKEEFYRKLAGSPRRSIVKHGIQKCSLGGRERGIVYCWAKGCLVVTSAHTLDGLDPELFLINYLEAIDQSRVDNKPRQTS